jgi:N-acetylglucosaminyl-diphospho-decaprenol L-rhamnosyltransferase
MADLGVIIVSFNSERWLGACLASVYGHRGTAELDVVVVDNGSADGSADLVEREFPHVQLVRGANRGFAYANNRGLERVDSEFVLFLNPDTEVLQGTFDDMLRLLCERPSVGLIGCRQVTRSGDLHHSIRRFPAATRHLCEALGSEHLPIRAAWLGERELDQAAYEHETPCDWVSGSFMLARREAVLDAGLMDERYFLYCEETDMCLGIKASGWEVRYLPNMTVFHDSGSDGHDARLVSQEAYARRQYMFKHYGALRRRRSMLALACFHGRRALGPSPGDPAAHMRRAAARRALLTVLGLAPPPFGELSGPLRGPRPGAPNIGRAQDMARIDR